MELPDNPPTLEIIPEVANEYPGEYIQRIEQKYIIVLPVMAPLPGLVMNQPNWTTLLNITVPSMQVRIIVMQPVMPVYPDIAVGT